MKKVSYIQSSELISLVEDKDKTIRTLTKKIEKLENTLKKTIKEKGIKEAKVN